MTYDPTIPVFYIPNDGIGINITIPQSDASLISNGETYNQSTVTYNQSLIQYEGVQNIGEDIIPLIIDVPTPETKIHLSIPQTQATVQNDGYTYDQATFTYNQATIPYEGINNTSEDVVPLLDMVLDTIPHIDGIIDRYSSITPPSGNNQSIGPGWFMYITH